MDTTTTQKLVGSISAGLALLVFLIPLQRLLVEWARREARTDQWVSPGLTLLAPQWLLLMVALLCVTASGGFDWLRMGRPMLYTLTVGASFALAAVSFVFIALYIRPGFTPRGLYSPVLYLVTFSTVLLVVLSLNQKLVAGFPTHWLIKPWTWFTAFSLVGSLVFSVYWISTNGVPGLSGIATRVIRMLPASEDELAQIAKLDPKDEFQKLVWYANRDEKPAVCEAATARLRSDPEFVERMVVMLDSGYAEPALAFVRDAALTPDEKKRFARPALNAMGRWLNTTSPPNYTTSENLKRTRRFGDEMFRVLPEKFAGTGVDFSEMEGWYKEKMEVE